MITTARPLSIKDILDNKKSMNEKTIWCGREQEEILTHRSWISLSLIFQWFNIGHNRKPIVAVPKYYCYETLFQMKDIADFVYFDINDTFVPDYKNCSTIDKEQKLDFFVFVHYFGIKLDANEAKIFCKNNGVMLIEDAVHTLLPQGKIGKYGDFVLYSPWKHLGLPDGAVLVINSKGVSGLNKGIVKEDLMTLNSKYEQYPEILVNKWKIKKIIQKILPNRKRSFEQNDLCRFKVEEGYRISEYSKNQLLNVSDQDVLSLGDKKRINALVLEDCLKGQYSFDVLNKDDIPYASVFQRHEDAKKLCDKVSVLGEVIFTWPDLDPTIEKSDKVYDIKNRLIHIAVHDGLTPGYINNKLYDKFINNINEKLSLSEISEQEYNQLCEKADKPVPILQSNMYVQAKEKLQGWKPEYWGIRYEENYVAFFITLKKYGFIYRINRGPYFVDKKYEIDVYQLIKKQFGTKGRILFLAPEDLQSGKNINTLLNLGYKYRNIYFSTGYVNLLEGEEVLRKKMDSKWRNQLKASEKLQMPVFEVTDEKLFNELLLLHQRDKEERSYKDSGDDITRYLFENGHLNILYVKGENDEVISMVMVATHYKTATYYIGWSNQEGYKKNANRLLLWEAIKYLKGKGYEWFDLGGIDMIHTRGIAEFKMGIGCNFVNLLGEYIS